MIKDSASRLRQAGRWILYGVVTLILTAAAGLAVLWWRLPEYQQEIKAWVHTQTGFYVRFDSLAPSLRWSGPELFFSKPELRTRDDARVLARARGVRIGFNPWRVLISGRIVPGRVRIDAPEATLTRIGERRFSLGGGLEFGGTASDPRLRLLNLPHGRIVIRGASITLERWSEELPHLHFAGLDMQARRALDRFEFEAVTRVPEPLHGGLSLEVTANHLSTAGELQWRGDVRVRNAWLPGWQRLSAKSWPRASDGLVRADIKASGRGGAFALSGEFAANRLASNLAPRSQPALTALSGHVDFSLDAHSWRIDLSRARAALDGIEGRESHIAARGRVAGRNVSDVQIDADYLALAVLNAALPYVPDSEARQRIVQWSPRGELSDAHFAYASPHWRIAARAQNFGVAPYGKLPGWQGLDGEVHGDDAGGRANIASTGGAISWPWQWPEQLPVTSLHASIAWKSTAQELLVSSQDVSISNPDARLAAKFAFTKFNSDRSAEFTLAGTATGVHAPSVRRYLPRQNIAPSALAWVGQAITAGNIPRAEFALRGPLADFPYRGGSGYFLVRFPVERLTLDYQPGWPALEQGEADVEFLNAGLSIRLRNARLRDLVVHDATASFADLASGELTIHARARAEAAAVLDYLAATPLNEMTGDAFSVTRAAGPLDAKLMLFFPFTRFDQRRVLVETQLNGVSASYKDTALAATELRGILNLDGPQVSAARLQGAAFGGPLQIREQPPRNQSDLATHLEARGSMTADALKGLIGLPEHVLGTGRIEWRAVTRVAPEPALERTVRVTSNLTGIEIKLPQPLAKTETQALPSYVNFDWPRGGGLFVKAGLSSIARGYADLDISGAQTRLRRAAVIFGGDEPQSLPDEPGISIAGRLEQLDLSGWLASAASDASGAAGAAPDLAEMLDGGQVQIGRLRFHGFEFREPVVNLSRDADHWHAEAEGPGIHGTVTLPRRAEASPIELKFSELTADFTADAAPNSPQASDDKLLTEPSSLPALSVLIDQLIWKGRPQGTLSAQLLKAGDGVTLDHITLQSPSFDFRAQGSWRGLKAGQCRLSGALRSNDVQATLAQFGYADIIQAKSGVLEFDLNWLGPPSLDAVPALNGTLALDAQKGQIVALHPGAGRVLGLASVATLPRRLALDFSDLTDKGLAFDQLHATFDIRDGDAVTEDALLKGPAAEIGIVGRVGLAKHDFDQIAVVTGSLGNSLPLASALAAGPVVGAAVLVFSQIFKQPLKGLARGYYRIGGTWDNPAVERIKSNEAEAAKKQDSEGTGKRP